MKLKSLWTKQDIYKKQEQQAFDRGVQGQIHMHTKPKHLDQH